MKVLLPCMLFILFLLIFGRDGNDGVPDIGPHYAESGSTLSQSVFSCPLREAYACMQHSFINGGETEFSAEGQEKAFSLGGDAAEMHKNSRIATLSFLSTGEKFTVFLSERYLHGFYIYFLRKIRV